MFLGGVIMTATGITLVLNYGVLDIELLPPDLDNEEGKRTVGIILTTCGLLAILVSVIVSILYLCTKTKPSINPDDISRIPSSARNNTPDRHDHRVRNQHGNDRTDRRSISSISAKVNASRPAPAAKTSKEIYSAEVKHRAPHRPRGQRKKHHRLRNRLDQIKEDAVSRKTVEGTIIEDGDAEDTPRSGSVSSHTTVDEQQRIPRITRDEFPRPTSADSSSTSQTSELGSFKFSMEGDKSRREFQFLPESVRHQRHMEGSRDSDSPDRFDETSLTESKNFDQCSLTSDNLRKFSQEQEFSTPMLDYNSEKNHSAGGIGGAQSQSPEAPDLQDVTAFRAEHFTERRGELTCGRISPQIGEPEVHTTISEVSNSRASLNS